MRLVTIIAIVLIGLTASATDRKPPRSGGPVEVSQNGKAISGSTAGSKAEAKATGGKGGSSKVGDVSTGSMKVGGDTIDAGSETNVDVGGTNVEVGETTIAGDEFEFAPVMEDGDDTVHLSTENSTNLFALALEFPQAGHCFGGVQGGQSGRKGSGFLGFTWLNKSCWLSQLAASEADADVRARLKCSDKHFRNAIAYDKPRSERQSACVTYMVDKHVDQLAVLRKQLEEATLAGKQ